MFYLMRGPLVNNKVKMTMGVNHIEYGSRSLGYLGPTSGFFWLCYIRICNLFLTIRESQISLI